jgi:hypothetical protein
MVCRSTCGIRSIARPVKPHCPYPGASELAAKLLDMTHCNTLKIAKLLTYKVKMTQKPSRVWQKRRLARWVIYAILGAPIVTILSRNLGVGAVAQLAALQDIEWAGISQRVSER